MNNASTLNGHVQVLLGTPPSSLFPLYPPELFIFFSLVVGHFFFFWIFSFSFFREVTGYATFLPFPTASSRAIHFFFPCSRAFFFLLDFLILIFPRGESKRYLNCPFLLEVAFHELSLTCWCCPPPSQQGRKEQKD